MEANPFSGIFDGNGHIISNMYVNRPNDNYNGLFGNAKSGYVKNLGIVSSYIIGNYNQAAIIGSYGTVKKCFSDATIKGNARTAGICGISCTVKDSYNIGNIINGAYDLTGGISAGWSLIYNSYNLGNIISNGNSVGGILGWDGAVTSSYNLGNVTGNGLDGCGGVLGQAVAENIHNLLKNNYNLGTVNGGGILGRQYGDKLTIEISGNYYLNTTANYGLDYYKTNEGAEPLSKDKMPSVISVINGDNAFVEDINNINNGYPILKWQANR